MATRKTKAKKDQVTEETATETAADAAEGGGPTEEELNAAAANNDAFEALIASAREQLTEAGAPEAELEETLDRLGKILTEAASNGHDVTEMQISVKKTPTGAAAMLHKKGEEPEWPEEGEHPFLKAIIDSLREVEAAKAAHRATTPDFVEGVMYALAKADITIVSDGGQVKMGSTPILTYGGVEFNLSQYAELMLLMTKSINRR